MEKMYVCDVCDLMNAFEFTSGYLKKIAERKHCIVTLQPMWSKEIRVHISIFKGEKVVSTKNIDITFDELVNTYKKDLFELFDLCDELFSDLD